MVVALWTNTLFSQASREKISLNEGWRFLPEGIAFGQNKTLVDDTTWEKVSIPHTWNAFDPYDDEKSYRRGISWYRKNIRLTPEDLKNKRAFLHFEAANQVADVYVNGIQVGRHKGGYTGFTFEITKAIDLEAETQLIAVMVNNAHDAMIAPLAIGYTLYGGIYRDVWLITTNETHFDLEDYSSQGVFIKTPEVSKEKATVSITGNIVNQSTDTNTLQVESIIYDDKDNVVASTASDLSVSKEEKGSYTHALEINAPRLWSPDDPYLYKVHSLIKKNGVVIDKIVNPLGCRWFSVDENKGFFLNGEHLSLRGTTRHQDMLDKGSALSNEDHRRDMQIVKDMGCNFIRISHYPQDPEVLRAADELGLIAWEEIPLVDYMTIDQEFLDNSKHMLLEMIHQHYNHPSVVLWGSMNEIFLWGNNEDRIKRQTDSVYMRNVAKFAKELNDLIEKEDPTRLSTIAMHGGSKDYDAVGIEDTPQVSSYNIYAGWYGGTFDGFGRFFDNIHKRKPKQKIFVSEYGAGGDLRLNSEKPIRFDFTGQYQRMFHEAHLKQINERDYFIGTSIWNEFDFSQPHVGGPIPHLNQKGMFTWDRKPKDVYYLYKANWNKEPMVHIAEKDWQKRAIANKTKTYDITIYTNLTSVELYVNSKRVGKKPSGDLNKIVWKVKLKEGKNTLRAVGSSNGKRIEDFTTIELVKYTNDAEQMGTNFAINVGSNAQYLDAADKVWIQDQRFDGKYGHKGIDTIQTLLNRKHIIRNSKHDPMYYTFLDDVKNYKLNVENGFYAVTMYFIENNKDASVGQRIFDVALNDKTYIKDLDLMEQVGFCYGLEKTVELEVTDNEISIDFKAQKGKAVLSGLEVTKIE